MEKDIGKLRKNDFTDVVIRVDDFGGKKGLTIREFVTGERYTGFTKSGVRIPAADFKKFREMLNSISEEDMAETEETTQEEVPKEQKTLEETEEDMPDY